MSQDPNVTTGTTASANKSRVTPQMLREAIQSGPEEQVASVLATLPERAGLCGLWLRAAAEKTAEHFFTSAVKTTLPIVELLLNRVDLEIKRELKMGWESFIKISGAPISLVVLDSMNSWNTIVRDQVVERFNAQMVNPKDRALLPPGYMDTVRQSIEGAHEVESLVPMLLELADWGVTSGETVMDAPTYAKELRTLRKQLVYLEQLTPGTLHPADSEILRDKNSDTERASATVKRIVCTWAKEHTPAWLKGTCSVKSLPNFTPHSFVLFNWLHTADDALNVARTLENGQDITQAILNRWGFLVGPNALP
ncbi:hypothetical protein Pelo_12588 [Pelomyxa schiedti]|nr:hypothetical protein Pelo_12588 [Pelomyxa schiedti]